MLPDPRCRATFIASLTLGLWVLPPPHPAPPPWNGSGHRILSSITWGELGPQAREEATRILRTHPRYQSDLLAGLPADADEDLTARWAFLAAANWPDTVRSVRNPLNQSHNRPDWHFINLPYSLDGVVPRPPRADAGDGPHDIVLALTANLELLRDRTRPDPERAIALCWVIHLTEDLHQPLHACTLVSRRFPDGDRGGNSFLVTRSPFDSDSQTNLHALWDSLLGSYQSATMDECVAVGLSQRPELARGGFARELACLDPATWAGESHALAIEVVYLGGRLDGSVSGSASDSKPPLLPSDYLGRAERTAMRRGVLAAYRLTDLLERELVRH